MVRWPVGVWWGERVLGVVVGVEGKAVVEERLQGVNSRGRFRG